jgi:hypothetical protein
MIPWIAASIFFALAALHLYWAVGGVWPGTNGTSLNQIVVGGAANTQPPSSLACLVVMMCLALAGWITPATQGMVPPLINLELNRLAALGVAGVLTLRGLGGYLETRFRPVIIGTPYAQLNLILYSPLCLALAAMVWWSVLT